MKFKVELDVAESELEYAQLIETGQLDELIEDVRMTLQNILQRDFLNVTVRKLEEDNV